MRRDCKPKCISGKTVFHTMKDATRFTTSRDVELRIYPCDDCNGYHVTSQIKQTERKLKYSKQFKKFME